MENLTLTDSNAINVTGNAVNNILTGNSGANILNGGAGADQLIGDLGYDGYWVDNAGDVVTETSTLATEIDRVNSAITFTLPANVENLYLNGTAALNGTGNALNNLLSGNAANNALFGGAGNDTLNGGAGNDTMDSGLGNDVLTGGAGLDVFNFTNLSLDTITDFSIADDTIQFENSVFTQLAAADANDYVFYNSNTGALLYDADGNGAGAVTQIAQLGVNLALTFADFFII